jgi:hypothetical protein
VVDAVPNLRLATSSWVVLVRGQVSITLNESDLDPSDYNSVL